MRTPRPPLAAIPAGIALLLLLPGTGAAAPEAAARVTSSVGSTLSGGDPLGQGGSLDDGAEVETGDDGGCSLLVDEDAVMEMCGGTSVQLTRKDNDPDGPRVVNLEAGEIRMVVEPRLGEERIEIHTPAAIATILGTIVHISVDALGVTTVASSAAKVLVTSADSSVPGSATVSAGEQVVISPGSPPSPPRRLDGAALAALGGCLIDFHLATVNQASSRQSRSKVQAAVQAAVQDATGPDVAAAAALYEGAQTRREPPALPGGANDPEAVFEGFNETFDSGRDLPGDDPMGGDLGGGDLPGVGDGPMGGGLGGGDLPGVGDDPMGGGLGGGDLPGVGDGAMGGDLGGGDLPGI